MRTDSHSWTKTRIATLAIAGLVAMSNHAAAQGKSGALTPQLQRIRTALDRYQDPVVAVREGYLSTLGCIDFPAGGMEHGAMQYPPGAMGVHFINMGNVGPTLDSLKPQVLMYEPVGDRLQLVAAEWFVPAQLVKSPPTMFGQQLQGPMEGHAPIMPAELHHYDLHVWLWKSNPKGVFTPTNSTVKCPKSPYSFEDKPPKMVKAGSN
jgi:hypothetical protein